MESKIQTSIVRLRDCLDRVIDYRGKTPPKSNSGIPALSSAHIKNGRLDLSSVTYVSDNTYNEWTTRGYPQAGDVLITTEAPVGEVALLPGDQTYLLTRRIFAMSGQEGVLDNKFLLYTMLSKKIQNKLLERVRGSTVPRVLKPDILDLEISLPKIDVQKEIAHILGTLDQKIELNKKANKNLEGIAKALFKSWFIDFDLVREKSEGSFSTVSNEISNLFPDLLENSEQGNIPSGWKKGYLSDIFSIQGGTQPPAKTFIEEKKDDYVRLLQIRDFSGDNHITYVPKSKNLRLVDEDNVLIGRYGSGNGRFMEDSLGRPLRGLSGAINVAIVKTTPKQVNMTELTYTMILSGWFYKKIVGGTSRAVQAGFRKEDLDQIPFAVPPNKLLDVFESLGSKLWKKCKINNNESNNLSILRDTLLSKLISGEISIKDAEKTLEGAGI